jgi:hypothetical protein
MAWLWGPFLHYRFDSAALAIDCALTFFKPSRPPICRVIALLWTLLILASPLVVLILGDEKFGDGWAFGLTLALFLVVLEAPGHLWRQGLAAGRSNANESFDWFLFALLTLVCIAAPLVVIEVQIGSDVLRGILWGMALVGAQDLIRSTLAIFLTVADGRPVYAP